VTALDDLPAMATVEEAAAVLRVSRRVAYEACRAYLASGGASGLPCVRVGKRVLRVPRLALEQLVTNSNGHRDEAPAPTPALVNIDHRKQPDGDLGSR
jgi:Helix-turn-helix domain